MNSTEACIALNMIPKMGPVRLRKLLQAFKSPERILTAKPSELRVIDGIGNETAEALASWQDSIDLGAELERIRSFGAHVLTMESPEYPEHLRQIHSPPMVLYVWGKLLERDRHAIAIVGSRAATHYGLECAKKLSFQIAYSGATVISGLARGIDTAAHQGALAAKGRTVAVLGSGLLHLYPSENKRLAELVANSGAVLSEFSMDTKADVQTFPMRNRIVSGLSMGVLVVEAARNSGAMITASQALEQGRSVYAVPGPIDRPTSAGCNRLIQQGAKLVTQAADILEEFELLFPERPLPKPGLPPQLAGQEKAIYEALGHGETSLESLLEQTGLPAGAVTAALLSMELKQLVKQLPGQRFVKLI